MSEVIDSLKGLYEKFDSVDLRELDKIYDASVVFRDPLHEIGGLQGMKDYFSNLSQAIDYCRFSFGDELIADSKAYLSWKMYFRHRQLNQSNEIVLRGVSHLEFGDKIVYHEDFYDMGAMVYEHVPVFGRAVAWLKRRIVS